jgi:hypothetical protein
MSRYAAFRILVTPSIRARTGANAAVSAINPHTAH